MLKYQEPTRISSCFAITVGTAEMVGFANHPGMLPENFGADVLEKCQTETGRN